MLSTGQPKEAAAAAAAAAADRPGDAGGKADAAESARPQSARTDQLSSGSGRISVVGSAPPLARYATALSESHCLAVVAGSRRAVELRVPAEAAGRAGRGWQQAGGAPAGARQSAPARRSGLLAAAAAWESSWAKG